MTQYNGWKNRQTWNVSLWINNDESLYHMAYDWMKSHANSRKPYADFIRYAGLTNDRTPDNIAYISTRISYKELNAMMKEMIA